MQCIKENMEKYYEVYKNRSKMLVPSREIKPPLHRAVATTSDHTASSRQHPWTLVLFITVGSRPEN